MLTSDNTDNNFLPTWETKMPFYIQAHTWQKTTPECQILRQLWTLITLARMAPWPFCDFPKPSLKFLWTFPEPSMNLPWTFPEPSLNLPWTFPEPSLNLPWTFPEPFLNLPESSQNFPRTFPRTFPEASGSRKPSETFRNLQGPSGTFWNLLEPFGTLWNIWNSLEPSGNFRNLHTNLNFKLITDRQTDRHFF